MVVVACAPGLRVVQSRAPGVEAWPRRGSRDLSILNATLLETKGTITETSCEVKYRCDKLLHFYRKTADFFRLLGNYTRKI